MRVLVTGGAGFVGKHVLHDLATSGHTPISFDRHPSGSPDAETDVTGDLLDQETLRHTIRDHQIDACVHLAGIAFVPEGWTDPSKVLRINVEGTIQLLQAFRAANSNARIVVVTSSEVYGRDPRPDVTEDMPLTPSNVYGVSKMAADLTALLFAEQYDMPIMTARPQNHIGPGQSKRFVVSAFAEQLIELKKNPSDAVIQVGNLASQRDFTDVRDVARAYRLLLEKGQSGEAYNIASGHFIRIQEVLDVLCDIAGIQPRREIDPERYRPTDSPPLLSIEKIRTHTGWEPAIPLRDSLQSIYEDQTAV